MNTLIKSFYGKLIFIVVFIYTLLGFVILPYLIQSNFSAIVQKQFNTNAYLSRVYFNPFTFEIGLHNMLIQDDKNETLLYFKSLKTDLELSQILFGEIHLKYIILDSLKTELIIYKDNKFNFTHILEQLEQNSSSQTKEKKIEIENTTSSPILFVLKELEFKNTTLLFKDNSKSLEFTSFIKRFSTSVTLKLENKELEAKLKNFTVNIPSIIYADKKFNINSKNINNTIKSIKITKNSILNFELEEIQVLNDATLLVDLIRDKNHELHFTNLDIKIDKFSSDKKQENKLSLFVTTPNNGELDIKLNTIQKPFNINGTATLKEFDVAPYKYYIKDFINIDVKKILLNINSKIEVNEQSKNILADIKISQINLFHNLTKKRLLQMNRFDIDGLNYKNNNLFIENIDLDDFSTSFKIASDKTTNIDDLLITKNDVKPTATVDKKSNFNYYIKKVKISNGKAEFSDHSLPLNFDTNIHSLHANISDLSSKNDEASVILKGVIEKYGLANIEAKTILSNYKNKTDVKINFENLDVRSFSPYSGKFIGQKIADGRLWLALDYSIRNAQLFSSNNIKIKNLTLGDDVESKDALSLPVGLAIALLEDSEGLIDLDVPIKGDMDKPEFELGGVIWKTLGNVITNIVTAPFRFLGSLLGMDTDELGNVAFSFASSEISPPQKEKLDKLIGVLQKKKNLVLIITPTVNILNDSKVLKEKKFNTLVQSENRNTMIKKIYIKRFSQEQFKNISKKYKDDQLVSILSNEIKKTIHISQDEINLLGEQRAQNIKAYFLSHKLRLDRIQIENELLKNHENDTKELSLKLNLNIKD